MLFATTVLLGFTASVLALPAPSPVPQKEEGPCWIIPDEPNARSTQVSCDGPEFQPQVTQKPQPTGWKDQGTPSIDYDPYSNANPWVPAIGPTPAPQSGWGGNDNPRSSTQRGGGTPWGASSSSNNPWNSQPSSTSQRGWGNQPPASANPWNQPTSTYNNNNPWNSQPSSTSQRGWGNQPPASSANPWNQPTSTYNNNNPWNNQPSSSSQRGWGTLAPAPAPTQGWGGSSGGSSGWGNRGSRGGLGGDAATAKSCTKGWNGEC